MCGVEWRDTQTDGDVATRLTEGAAQVAALEAVLANQFARQVSAAKRGRGLEAEHGRRAMSGPFGADCAHGVHWGHGFQHPRAADALDPITLANARKRNSVRASARVSVAMTLADLAREPCVPVHSCSPPSRSRC